MARAQGVLDIIRGRLLTRIASRVDRRLTVPAHTAAIRMPLYGRSTSEALQPLRDVEAIRSFIGGQCLVALIDLPWFPLYLAFVFLLLAWLGWVATIGAVVLIGVALLTDWLTRAISQESSVASASRLAIAEANVRNAEVLCAMGFGRRALDRYAKANAAHLIPYLRMSDTLGSLGRLSKILRLILQSGILGLGAYLTLMGDLSAGAIVAASIASASTWVRSTSSTERGSFPARRGLHANQRADAADLPLEAFLRPGGSGLPRGLIPHRKFHRAPAPCCVTHGRS